MLKIEDLTFNYPGQQNPALESINVEVTPGKLVLVTGPSGSGKSTLLHCINGLATMHYGGSAQGQMSVAGREIQGKLLCEISELVGTLFQNPNTQFFQLTVEDEIVFGLEHTGLDKQTIEKKLVKALEDVEISHLRHRDLFTLSSGEKQKVALASILAMDQPLLLFDEPTANLDIHSIHEIQRILGKLKKQGRTILISEHRLWYLRELADQIMVIKEGRVIYKGEPEILSTSYFRSEIGLRIWDQTPETKESLRGTAFGQGQPAILNASNLSGGLGGKKKIVKNIDFSLKPGSSIAIMGQNGAGKTMLSRILTGLQKETEGTVTISKNILKPKNRLGKIACVSQQADQQLFSDTAIDELLIQSQKNTTTKEEAENILKNYDLLDLKDKHPQTLSGGEKQRLAIAASMITHPQIIILDEPTSGMDLKRMEKLSQEIKKLCSRNILVIIITHDIELAALCCDRILWMENGKIARHIEPNQYEELFNELMEFNSEERQENEMHGCLLK